MEPITKELIIEAGVLTTLVALLILILLDSIAGAALAIKRGEFDARLWPQFLLRGVLPYVLTIGAIAAGALLAPEPYAAFFVALFVYPVVTAFAKYLADFKDKLKAIFGKAVF